MSELTQEAIKAKIKEMEKKNRGAAAPADKLAMVDFDSWFHIRKSQIPAQHLKEILVADFKSRGLGKEATVEQFDKALGLYGIKLN